MSLGINLADYAKMAPGQAVFGSGSQEDLNHLQKALEAGSITGRETANMTTASGSPLKVESLDKTLKHITFKESEIVFWNMLPKKAA